MRVSQIGQSRQPIAVFHPSVCWHVLTLGLTVLLSVGCERKSNPQASVKSEDPQVSVAKTTPPAPPAPPEVSSERLANVAATKLNQPKTNSLKQSPPKASEIQASFSVMTWNLEWFYDESTTDNRSALAIEKSAPDRSLWDWRRDAVAAAIAKVQPTVVALQEVESRTVLWYLSRALDREHKLKYDEYAIRGNDFFTEQDVGILVNHSADALWSMQGNRTRAMQRTKKYNSVPKHLLMLVEVPVGDQIEQVLIANVHFRSKPEADSLRAKQAATVSYWLREILKTVSADAPVHLVVTGDFNSEQLAGEIKPGSELDILMTQQTDDPSDDLFDCHDWIDDPAARRTHLLPGRQFDRILVSRSLITDTPDVPDLVIQSVEVHEELAIQGERDEQEAHWDRYWQLPEDERDLSDHYPVMATFTVQ